MDLKEKVKHILNKLTVKNDNQNSDSEGVVLYFSSDSSCDVFTTE